MAIISNRYYVGGKTEYVGKFLSWWERRIFQTNPDDVVVILDSILAKRPDKVSKIFYGSEVYSWFVLQYNNIVDIEEEFVVGKKISLPTNDRFRSIIGRRSL